MNLHDWSWRAVLRGVRTGDPAVVVGGGLLFFIVWLRRHPRERTLLASHRLKPGEEIRVRVGEPDEHGA